MKKLLYLLPILPIFFLFSAVAKTEEKFGESAKCNFILQAINDADKIKPGMTRKDLQKSFTTQGGLYTRTGRTYVYQKCLYIKIDVEFEEPAENDQNMSGRPDDKITEVSKPYLELGVFD